MFFTYSNHLKSHVDLVEIMCLICSIKFTDQPVLMKHLEHHMNNKKLLCTLCTNTYNSKDGLQNHIDQEHRKSHKLLQENQNESNELVSHESDRCCTYCKLTFESEKLLRLLYYIKFVL